MVFRLVLTFFAMLSFFLAKTIFGGDFYIFFYFCNLLTINDLRLLSPFFTVKLPFFCEKTHSDEIFFTKKVYI